MVLINKAFIPYWLLHSLLSEIDVIRSFSMLCPLKQLLALPQQHKYGSVRRKQVWHQGQLEKNFDLGQRWLLRSAAVISDTITEMHIVSREMGCTELYIYANRKRKVESSSMGLKYNTKNWQSKWQEADLKNIKYRQRTGKNFKESEYAKSWNIKIQIKTEVAWCFQGQHSFFGGLHRKFYTVCLI